MAGGARHRDITVATTKMVAIISSTEAIISEIAIAYRLPFEIMRAIDSVGSTPAAMAPRSAM